MEDNYIKTEKLIQALSKMLDRTILRADYQSQTLHGGTLGDVRLLTGTAETEDGVSVPFKLVWKSQKKWERSGDPNSWRREYDLYCSDFGSVLTDSLRWPDCYLAQLDTDETQLWMEYIDGTSGSALGIEMLEQAATELGRFQGRTAASPSGLRGTKCLGDTGFLRREFSQWHTQSFTYDFLVSEACCMPEFLKRGLRDGEIVLIDGKSFEYSLLRSKGCGIPEHLKRMLYEIDEHMDDIFIQLQSLPAVLCHRDFWNENVFHSEGKIRLIDWDTAGWGVLGEDIASLIVDGMESERFEENFRRLIPAYLKGVSEYMEVPADMNSYILKLILIKFGYRMTQDFMFYEKPDENSWRLNSLQKFL